MANLYWRQVKARIVAIMDEIPEIKTAFSGVPRQLREEQLPAIVVTAGAMTRQKNGADAILENRQFQIDVYLKKPTEGIQFEAEDDAYALDMMEKVYDQLDGRRRLQLSDQGMVFDSLASGDDGLVQFRYPANTQTDNTFFGFSVRLSVQRNFVTQQKV